MKITMHSSAVRIILLILVTVESLVSQDHRLGTIAVLRMKNVNVTPENESAFTHYDETLNSALGKTGLFAVPDMKDIRAALKDKSIDPNDLISLDEYFAAAKNLSADYIVIGSITQNVQTQLAQARLYAVQDKSLKGIIRENMSPQSIQNSTELIAGRIARILESPPQVDSAYASFQWSREFRFAFGPDRIDVRPPAVYHVSDSPPFELSVKASMEFESGSYVVTEFDLYADDQVVAAIHPDIAPPRVLPEKRISIAGREFCFRTEVKELRGRFGEISFISSARIVISARYCD